MPYLYARFKHQQLALGLSGHLGGGKNGWLNLLFYHPWPPTRTHHQSTGESCLPGERGSGK